MTMNSDELKVIDENGTEQRSGETVPTLNVNRDRPVITHIVGPNATHRLQIERGGRVERSPWTPSTEITRLGKYAAVTDAFANQLPQVFRIVPLAGDEFATVTVQKLDNL